MPVELFAAVTLPGHDPDLASWFVTLLEAVAAAAAGLAFAGQSPRRWRDRSFWLVVSLVMLVFAVNKQFDVQTSLPDPGTAFSVLLALSVGTLSYLLWGSTWLSRYRLAVLGVATLVAFALLRAGDIGGAPHVAGRFGHAESLPVEAFGAALVVVGSMRQVSLRSRSPESGNAPSTRTGLDTT